MNSDFRQDLYRQIIDDRKKLEAMLAKAECELDVLLREKSEEIDTVTAEKVSGIRIELEHRQGLADSEREIILSELRSLLLDGLEQQLQGDTIYKHAGRHLSTYVASYLTPSEENRTADHHLMLGVVEQAIPQEDDGTLDHYLSTILQNQLYTNSKIFLPVAINPYLEKSICITYSEEAATRAFDLLGKFALQMMNLHLDVGITSYLVDCTNMGSGFADFAAVSENDPDRRVNIIRTLDELNKVVDELTEYTLDSQSSYLRSEFSDIESFNASARMQREVRAIYIANLSEVTNTELLEKIIALARNGSRSGVMVFIGIPNHESQSSNLLSESREMALQYLTATCDCLVVDQSGDMYLDNGIGPVLDLPPVTPSLQSEILNATVQRKAGMDIIPINDHLPRSQDFFTNDCREHLVIPVGTDASGAVYCINFNKEVTYMLIGGNPSSGKSSLIHSIILQCISRYSPENLELYLADLKDGSEFDIYVEKGVKAVKVVLDDAESEVATSLLTYIKAKKEERLRYFKKLEQLSGKLVRNIEDFYQVNGEHHLVPHLPRILFIVDEFQSLFDSTLTTGLIANDLVRFCRTVGIHILMASQRVQSDLSTTRNSFTDQTRDYFHYRVAFKLPQSGVKELFSDYCVDTEKVNSAMRRVPTLKTGQMVVNSNQGSTEEENRLVQCFYPDNQTIAQICDEVVNRQGKETGIILNSERQVSDTLPLTENEYIVLGESNRLYHDACQHISDNIIDNRIIAIKGRVNRLLVCGNDLRVQASSLLLIASYLLRRQSNLKMMILTSKSDYQNLGLPDWFAHKVRLTESLDDFLAISEESGFSNDHQLLVVINPHQYREFHQGPFQSNCTPQVERLVNLLQSPSHFTLVLSRDSQRLKENLSYLLEEIPCRIISVGDVSSIKKLVSHEVGDLITSSPFNTVRPNLIKAYYYNASSDRLGRFRLPSQERIVEGTGIDSWNNRESEAPLVGYQGLSGN